MEQRPLRLGDIVDDYCPRERRITNHVIVALMDDRVQQTRCTTCESEHAYKEARVPKRRKKDEAGVLVVPGSPPAAPDQPVVDDAPVPVLARNGAVDEPVDEPVAASNEDPAPEPNGTEEAWFGHRRLIRASLPKTDAEPLPRPIPEFTMHQRQPSGNHFRHGYGGNGSGYNGFRHGRPGGGQGQGQGSGGQNRGQGGGRPNRGGRGRHRGGNGGSKPSR